MRISMLDVAIYIYTLGGIVTGIFIQRTFSTDTRLGVIALGALVAVFWVAYFNKAIAPRYSLTVSGADPKDDPAGSDNAE